MSSKIPKDRYISAMVRYRVINRDKNKCVYCGYKYQVGFRKWLRKLFGRQYQQVEFGHVIPHSKGGTNCEQNIQIECFKHNRGKGATHVPLNFWKRWTRQEAQGCDNKRCKHLK